MKRRTLTESEIVPMSMFNHLLGNSQYITPNDCLSVCGHEGDISKKCQAAVTPTMFAKAPLSPVALGLIIASGVTFVIITVTCVVGVGRYYLRRHYQLRYRDYQPIPVGADIAPPKI